MAGRQQQVAVFTGLRGRDGHEQAEVDIPGNKARECWNVDFFRTTFARKRGGARSIQLGGSGMTGILSAMHRHVPGANDRLAELWIVDDATAPHLARLYPWAQTSDVDIWQPMTWKTPITGPAWEINFVSFNGKLYILGDSSVDRLQVFDPSGTVTPPTPESLRFAGLQTPIAPETTNAGTTTIPATARYYRVIYTVQGTGAEAGVTLRRSLASAVKGFTNVANNGVEVHLYPYDLPDRVPIEGETHWELYGAEDAEGPYYWLMTQSAENAEWLDLVNPVDYWKSAQLMPLQGDNTPPWSAKYGIADDNRLLLAGAWEPGHSQNEVWFSPVLGSTSPLFDDDERIPSTNRISFNEQDSSYITALGGPIGSTIIVFKNVQTWRLIPTGDEADPYRRRAVSKTVGCLHQRTVVLAEDETGIPTIYWLSEQGPYRYNLASGLARLTWDVQDIWEQVNINAATIVAHGVAHPAKHQIWWWIAVGNETSPGTRKLVYDTHLGRVVDAGLVRDGWAVHDGASAIARCSVMYSRTWDSAHTSRDLAPYIGQSQQLGGIKPVLWICDVPMLSDNGQAFAAWVRQPQRHLAGLDHRCQLGHPAVLGSTGDHAYFSVNQDRDYGESLRGADVSMKAAGTETRVLRVVEGVESADVSSVALGIGDRVPVASWWLIDAVLQPFETREPVVT